MKILLICGDDHKYGSAKAALNILKMRETYDDVEFTVITQSYGAINEFCNRNNINNLATGHSYAVIAPPSHLLPRIIKTALKKIIVSIKNIKAIKKIEKQLCLNGFDIVHTNIDRDIIGCFLSKKYNKTHIIHLREYAKGHYNVVPLYNHQINFMNKYSSMYIAISQAVKTNWENVGADSNKIQVVYDGVDVNSIQPRKKSAIDKPIKFVMCGDISPLKGQDQAVKAVHQVMNKIKDENVLSLDIYGETHGNEDYYNELTQFINDNNLQNIIKFKGYSSELFEILKDYDAGIVCSKNEGFGLSTAEFMAAGLGVIVSDTGANKELINDRTNGLVYHYKDIDDLSNKIKELCNNPNCINQYGAKARNDVEYKFSLKSNEENIYRQYCRLLQQ